MIENEYIEYNILKKTLQEQLKKNEEYKNKIKILETNIEKIKLWCNNIRRRITNKELLIIETILKECEEDEDN